jgi:hypothetical protein
MDGDSNPRNAVAEPVPAAAIRAQASRRQHTGLRKP